MAIKKGEEGYKGMQVQVPPELHEKLCSKARDRRMHLNEFHKAVLEWAGEMSVETLIGAGVKLPVWPSDPFHPASGECS